MAKRKPKKAEFEKCIYMECDGFHYYLPPKNHGCYSAHYLRQIADRLDEINKPWQDSLNAAFAGAEKHDG